MAISNMKFLSTLLLLVAAVNAQSSTASAASSSQSGDGSSYIDPNSVDTGAGASGSDGGFVKISRGTMIAIIVVVVVFAVGGIVSAVLFYVAKRRQWQIRQSIRRSARRMTSNFTSRNNQRKSRRQTGVSKMSDITDSDMTKLRGGKRVTQQPSIEKSSRKEADLEKGEGDKTIKKTELLVKPQPTFDAFQIQSPRKAENSTSPFSTSSFGKKYGR